MPMNKIMPIWSLSVFPGVIRRIPAIYLDPGLNARISFLGSDGTRSPSGMSLVCIRPTPFDSDSSVCKESELWIEFYVSRYMQGYNCPAKGRYRKLRWKAIFDMPSHHSWIHGIQDLIHLCTQKYIYTSPSNVSSRIAMAWDQPPDIELSSLAKFGASRSCNLGVVIKHTVDPDESFHGYQRNSKMACPGAGYSDPGDMLTADEHNT